MRSVMMATPWGRVGQGRRGRGGPARVAAEVGGGGWVEEVQVTESRTRLNSKRTRPVDGDEEDMDSQPAAKH